MWCGGLYTRPVMADERHHMIAVAEAEIRSLEDSLERKREALAWMKVLASREPLPKPEARPAPKARKPKAASAEGGKGETWPERIERVLQAAAPKTLTVAQITGALDKEGAFAGVNMVPANLIRANLKRRKDAQGWKCRKIDGVGHWGTTPKEDAASA